MAAMPFAPIEPVRTIDTVAEKLEERIIDGTFPRGARLPSESQIAEQLHVGRRTVREALKVLETKGLVEVKMGVGAIVKRNDLDGFLRVLARNIHSYLSINKVDLIQIMELRWLLERAALQKIMQDPDEARLARLRACIAAQRQADRNRESDRYQQLHFDFHNEIIDALNNPVISMIYRQALALVRPPMERTGSIPEVRSRAIADHATFVDALEHRDGERLEAALQRHLAEFIDHLTASEQAEKAAAAALSQQPAPVVS